jgi:hypothetical protein
LIAEIINQISDIKKIKMKKVDQKDLEMPKKSFENSVVRKVIISVKKIEKGINQSLVFFILAMNSDRMILSLSSVISIKSDLVFVKTRFTNLESVDVEVGTTDILYLLS